MAKKKSESQAPPVVRVAPLGELRAYVVSEHELEALAKGSSASLFLNFALCLLPVSITLLITLVTTTIAADRLYQTFVTITAVTAIAGTVLLVLWCREHKSSADLLQDIRNRMPPPVAIQQRTVVEHLVLTEQIEVDRIEGGEPDSQH